MALYLLLAEKGYFFSERELSSFCCEGSFLGGHPEFGKVPGVEISSGSLGHGLSMGIGMALSARFDGRNSRIFVLIGDGESNEGSVWEGALSAANRQLDNLTVIIDYNKYHPMDQRRITFADLEPLPAKWEAFGWSVVEINGHSISAIYEALNSSPVEKTKPTVIISHSIKGAGIPSIEHDLTWHHKSNLSENECRDLLAELEACVRWLSIRFMS